MRQLRAGRRWLGVAACIGLLCPDVVGLGIGSVAHAQSLDGRAAAGELKCTVEGRLELVVSANRDLTCTFFRSADHRAEFYTGYTGIIGGGLGVSAPYEVDFQVFSPDPGDQAALEGDFQSRSGGRTVPGELMGGKANAIDLLPDRDAPAPHSLSHAAALAPINAIAGFGYLHLIYAGVVPVSGHRHGVRRRPQ